MGNTLQKPKEATLLPPAMSGDLDMIKQVVGEFLASYSTPNVGKVEFDPELQEFVDRADPQGNSAIHGAVFGGHLEVVEYLVDKCGASLTKSNNLGCSPLWLAAGYDKVAVLEYILEKVDNPQEALLMTNTTGDTAMIAAASRGNLSSMKVLIDFASKHSLKDKIMATGNRNGDTPLKVAVAMAASGEVVDFLLDNSSPSDLNTPNNTGLTPLLVACERDDVELLERLIKRGADLSMKDSNGSSALAVAAFCGNKSVMEKVLLHEGNENSLLDEPNDAGCSPIWLAARSGRPEVVQMLLDAGADPTKPNNDGVSAVQCAEKYERLKVVALFRQWTESRAASADIKS